MLKQKNLTLGIATTLLALSVGNMAVNASGTEEQKQLNSLAPSAPVQCEIITSSDKFMTSIKTVVHSEIAIEGSYQFQLVSTSGFNNSNINQGGYFTLGSNESITLGNTMLGGNAIYDAQLEINIDGDIIECEKRIGGTV